MSTFNLTMLTDLYELTMMQGYFKSGKQTKAVFEAFYRKNPCDGSYAIAAGLQQVIEYIENLHFTQDDIAYLRGLRLFEEDFLEYLASFRFSGDIYAVPEGSIIFPGEPILKVVAPVMEAQLLETALLNIINHQSLIATKASRICHAAQGDVVLEFGLRRAQGPDAATYGARAAIIGGCKGTSNVLCGKMFDVPVMGTHSHSWIMSFPDELTAFRTYAKLYPNACTLLIDTYDTLTSGLPNAITVFRELRAAGVKSRSLGVRLDSGDLASLSKKVRRILDDAGFPDVMITASNDLDEHLIQSLKMQGAAITAWGVGTHLITAKDSPSFGGVYKLVAIEDEQGVLIPKIKFSENLDKITNPGDKTVYRIYDNYSGKIRADLICLKDETIDIDQDLTLFDPDHTWKKTSLRRGSYTVRELLVPVILGGQTICHAPDVMEIRAFCNQEKDTLREESMRFRNPQKITVCLSQKLYDLKTAMLQQASES